MTSNQTDLPVDDAPITADFHTFRFCLKQIAITPVGMPFRLAHADLPARYPENWSPTHPGKGYDYHRFYTLNDGVMLNNIRTLLDAYQFYGKRAYLDGAKKGGDFLVLAQMPDPQPAWAQQYDFQMRPAWARQFEPPAISAGESAGAIRALLELFLFTGDERYWRPIPKAIAWLQRSRLPDGQWARFYELKTNRPLYFNRRYELVYTDADLPRHYAFKGEFGIPSLMREVERVISLPVSAQS